MEYDLVVFLIFEFFYSPVEITVQTTHFKHKESTAVNEKYIAEMFCFYADLLGFWVTAWEPWRISPRCFRGEWENNVLDISYIQNYSK